MNQPINHTEVLSRAATRILDLVSFKDGVDRCGHDTYMDDAGLMADAVAIIREELGVSACQNCGMAVINCDHGFWRFELCGGHGEFLTALAPHEPGNDADWTKPIVVGLHGL